MPGYGCYLSHLRSQPPLCQTRHFTPSPFLTICIVLFPLFMSVFSVNSSISPLPAPPLPPPSYLCWCVCPGSGFWWILSCNGQRAAVVSDVCMTCFPPEPISSSQPACFFFLVFFLGYPQPGVLQPASQCLS